MLEVNGGKSTRVLGPATAPSMVVEVGLLMPLLYAAGHSVKKSWNEVLIFFSSFVWPHVLRPHMQEVLNIFEKKTAPGDFKPSAPQGLSMCPLLRLFVLVHGMPLSEATVCKGKATSPQELRSHNVGYRGRFLTIIIV